MVIPSYLSQFNYQLAGPEHGKKWVFLHGLLGSAANWRRIIGPLSKTDRVLAFDQRGHGRSFQPLSGYAPSDFAEDLFLIAEELKFEKFILVGHSMGGRNALSFAHKFPEKVEKLVIEDIGPEGDPEAPEYFTRLFGSIPTPFPDKQKAKEFFMNKFPKELAKLKDLDRQSESADTFGAYLYSNLDEKSGAVDWRFSKDAIFQTVKLGRASDQWDELRNLTMPTLIVRGQNSKELTPEVFRQMGFANPNIACVEVPNAGHWVHADQPEQFLQILRDFAL